MRIDFFKVKVKRRHIRMDILKVSLSFLLLLSCGCAHLLGLVTYYDHTTYKNLTDLKPEVIALYDTFSTDSIDMTKIAAIRLKLAQIYEYENGKGAKNAETTKEVKIIQKMFERHVNDRLTEGKWSDAHTNNKKGNIADAFNEAIETEVLKNKND
jgi:hypothetical protein